MEKFVEKAVDLVYGLYNEHVLNEEEYNVLARALNEIEPLRVRDGRIESVWESVAGIPIDPEKNVTLAPVDDWPAGTNLNALIGWFDARYSKGAASLIYQHSN